ncbi:MAG TPA: hypothetical protein VHB69_01265 [Mycobacteriales bacterium]|nr:hypothetical protein [Mycobacteriales bacterium]
MTVLGLSVRTVRAALTALIVLALLAGLGFSVRRTTTRATSQPASSVSPVVAATNPPAVSAQPPVTAVPLPVSAPLPATGATATPSPTATPATTPPASPSTSSTAIPAVKVAAIGKCPIKLSTPKVMGGVQSLVAFAPAFGPFSAEAFAAAAAYQPELELLGPILAQYPEFAPVVEPALKPVLSLFSTGSNALFSVIAPLYKPYRTQVLSAETKLAAALAPYSAKVAGTPLAGCVVDLEAALVRDTKKSK